MTGPLSPEQFAAKAAHLLAAQGGMSMKLGSGRSPRRGMMVSEHGAETVVPGMAGPKEISSFAEQHRADLQRPHRYLGGWADSGNTYLDVSQRHLNPSTGIHAGREHGQIAVYDIGHDRSIDPYGGAIKYRGNLFENMSRHERGRLSRSNSAVARSRTRERLSMGPQFNEPGGSSGGRQLRFPGMA